ncbi:MAG: TRAP transporter fused permease subunit [Desulfobacterales bacterium]|nr:TRAP transporter fused permease subunit [Desulfobacterales bacterium]
MSDNSTEHSAAGQLTGLWKTIERILLVAIPLSGILFILDIHLYFNRALFREQYLSTLLGLMLASIFIGVRATRGISGNRPPWYDVIMAAMSLGIGVFSSFIYPDYIHTGIAYMGPGYSFLGLCDILLVMEATRRMTGWSLVLLGGFCIFFARYTFLFPSPFYGKGIPWNELLIYLFLDNSGLLGLPLWVAGAIVFAFILFGEFLIATGGSQLLNNFAIGIFGRFRGGPAKVAVVASSLFGTISGSAVSNVMATGVMTIPLMKKTGYKPVAAGAIEAAASTGGQLLPPVMGVTAFILAEFLGISYAQVALAATIPAVLYYFALFLQVDLEAAKGGFKGLAGALPGRRTVFKGLWILLVPLVVLVYTLFALNWRPGLSALAAAAALLVLSSVKKETRMDARKLLQILERAGRGMLMMGPLTGMAGIVIGAVYVTGVGFVFSLMLLKVGAQNLFLMLIIVAALCIVLGMGLPTGALYIILAVLVAPALVDLGVLPLAAHMFILYFGLMSMITPPVCFASYAGAAIAQADPMKTGFYAVRFGIAAYIIPFIFVYFPALILQGTIQDIIFITVKSAAGLGFIAISLTGFLFRKLNWAARAVLALGALGILFPPGIGISVPSWAANLGGLALSLPVFFREWVRARTGRP